MATTHNSNKTSDLPTITKDQNNQLAAAPKSNNANNLHNNVEARLLDTAERLFAEKGFDATSVRDITNHAGCNVAAVNYHFKNKQNLYTEVCRRRMAMMRDVRISSIDSVLSQTDHVPTLEELI
ncbi:MAG: helix-turn-helix transcriptional regulator, partial [Planctomycetota bacterium]